MLYQLRRHPFGVTAWFEHCLVLTYALPAELLNGLLPPGLHLDTHVKGKNEYGFVAIAMVQTRALRPTGFPKYLGQDFFLSGYRVFTKFQTLGGRILRGLRILRSDTDRRLLETAGNLLTHYNYRQAKVRIAAEFSRLDIRVETPDRGADLSLVADLSDGSVSVPSGSCFRDDRQARRFAGPLPYTFDYEPETHSIVVIKGVRQNWRPRPVHVEVFENTFLEHPPFGCANPVLASAFYVHDIPYCWKRGVRHPITEEVRC